MLHDFLASELVPSIYDRLSLMSAIPKRVLLPGVNQTVLTDKLLEIFPNAVFFNTVEGSSVEKFDLVVANLFLPWINLESQLTKYKAVLNPGGILLVTMLGPDTLREFKSIDLNPNVIDMHDLGDTLVKSGFESPVLDVDILTLLYRDEEKCLTEMQDAKMFKSQVESVTLPTDSQGNISLTIEVIYAHAFLPMQKFIDGEVRVPVSDIAFPTKT